MAAALLFVLGLGLFVATALLWQGYRRRRTYNEEELWNMGHSEAWRDHEKPDGV